MKEAILKAESEKYEEKPLLFSPVFERLDEFEVKGE